MKCPNCGHDLAQATYKGMEINQCSACQGMWFSFKELDQLEDTVIADDDVKGTLVWNKQPSSRMCPVCEKKMVTFNYRLDDLALEYCEQMHGYWLDKGEADRVVEEMKEDVERIDKKYNAEEEWARHLRRLQSPSFFDTLKKLF
jgi:Zn-finger nucleic acid-binding protein